MMIVSCEEVVQDVFYRCIHIYRHVHIYMCIHFNIYAHTLLYVYTLQYIRTYTSIGAYNPIYTRIHFYMCIHFYRCVHFTMAVIYSSAQCLKVSLGASRSAQAGMNCGCHFPTPKFVFHCCGHRPKLYCEENGNQNGGQSYHNLTKICQCQSPSAILLN